MSFKAKVSSKGVPVTVQLRGEFQRQILEGKNGRLLSQRIGTFTRTRFLLIVNQHWAHLMKSMVGLFKEPNQSEIYVTKMRKIRLLSQNGRTAVVKTEPWKRLSDDYARRSPLSRTFWKKTGVLGKLMARSLTRPRKVKVTHHSVKRTTKEITTVRVSVRFPRLPPPLNVFITAAFIHGNAGIVSAPQEIGGSRKDSVWRIFFPETQRPFVRLVAARLGKELRARIKIFV